MAVPIFHRTSSSPSPPDAGSVAGSSIFAATDGWVAGPHVSGRGGGHDHHATMRMMDKAERGERLRGESKSDGPGRRLTAGGKHHGHRNADPLSALALSTASTSSSLTAAAAASTMTISQSTGSSVGAAVQSALLTVLCTGKPVYQTGYVGWGSPGLFSMLNSVADE